MLKAARTDPDAFGELYARYESIVVAALVRQTRDVELAADLAAETFAQALVHAGRFQGEDGSSAVGWLLGIARNLALNALRQGRAESRARQKLGVTEVVLASETIERAEQLLDADFASARLNSALQGLPDSQREAVLAYVVHERPYDEIAQELRIPAATVRQRVSRGLAQVRTAFEGVDQ